MPDLRLRESNLHTQLDALDAQLLDRASDLALAESLESFLARLRDDAAQTASRAVYESAGTASASAREPPLTRR